MKIEVIEQTKRFYLAFEKWKPAVGHEIKVGGYRFCAIPVTDGINISEVNSGMHLFTIPMSLPVILATSTKEGTMDFLYKVGESALRVLEREKSFDKKLAEVKKMTISKLGKMPEIEDVDTDWVFQDESDVLN